MKRWAISEPGAAPGNTAVLTPKRPRSPLLRPSLAGGWLAQDFDGDQVVPDVKGRVDRRMVLGTTPGVVDAADPYFLPYDDYNYLWLPNNSQAVRVSDGMVVDGVAGGMETFPGLEVITQDRIRDDDGELWDIIRPTGIVSKAVIVEKPVAHFALDQMWCNSVDELNMGYGQDFTAMISFRIHDQTVTSQTAFSKKSSTAASAIGWYMFMSSGGLFYGSVNDGGGHITRFTPQAPWVQKQVTLALTVEHFVATHWYMRLYVLAPGEDTVMSTLTQPGWLETLESTTPVNIGRIGNGQNDAMEWFGSAIFREALSQEDIERMAPWLGNYQEAG